MPKLRTVISVLALCFVAIFQAFAGTPATITSPTNGTKLSSASATFDWSGGSGVTQYTLYVGTTKGAHDIDDINAGTASSQTVSNLPTNGEAVYVTLYSLIGSTEYPEYYTYYASGTGTAASMTSPTNNSTLSGASATFQWNSGVGIDEYEVLIGSTSGAYDIDFKVLGATIHSYAVTNLPTNGEKVYVTLYSLNGNTWLHTDFTYIASGTGAAATMSSPTNNSTLSGASATFQWGGGVGIDEYEIFVGSTSGGHDIDFKVLGSKVTSFAATNLPTNGEKVYVTLYSLNGNTWLHNSYTYIASGKGTAASITSPTNGTVFTNSDATFEWSGGVGIDEYEVLVGSSPGADDLDFKVLGPTYSSYAVTNLPINGEKIYVTLYSLNGATWLKTSDTYTAAGTALTFANGGVNQALVSTPYADQVFINGGSAPYTLSLSSGALPAGLSITNGTQPMISGTPTTVGTSTFVLKVKDSLGNTGTSGSLSLTVNATPDAKHNSYVKGTYVCSFQGYLDSDSSEIGWASSVVADGSGHLTSGVVDFNGRTAGYATGPVSGTYNLGSNNNGVTTITVTPAGSSAQSFHFLLMANTLAGPVANELALVEDDDVGSSPSGQHGAGVCYLADTTKFVASTIGSNSFVFNNVGENGSGIQKAAVGRFTSSNGTGGGTWGAGVVDGVKGDVATLDAAFTGTWTTPNSTTGRFTGAFVITGDSSGGSNFALYIIDANRIVMIRTDGSGTGLTMGVAFKQQKSSFSNSNLSGAFVFYNAFNEVDSSNTVQRWMSEIIQGTGNGSGSVTINQSYSLEVDATDGSEDYRVGDDTGTITGISVASNGRVTGFAGSAVYLYDTNAGLTMAYSVNGGGYTDAGLGNIEPQSSTSGLTDSKVVGSYLITTTPQLNPTASSQANVITITYPGSGSTDNITGAEDKSGSADFGYANPITATYGLTSTSFGTANVTQGSQVELNCIFVSATRQICMETDTESPRVSIVQQ